jgi:hypothetical protein
MKKTHSHSRHPGFCCILRQMLARFAHCHYHGRRFYLYSRLATPYLRYHVPNTGMTPPDHLFQQGFWYRIEGTPFETLSRSRF